MPGNPFESRPLPRMLKPTRLAIDICPTCGKGIDHNRLVFDEEACVVVFQGKVLRLGKTMGIWFGLLWRAYPKGLSNDKLMYKTYAACGREEPDSDVLSVTVSHHRKQLREVGIEIESIIIDSETRGKRIRFVNPELAPNAKVIDNPIQSISDTMTGERLASIDYANAAQVSGADVATALPNKILGAPSRSVKSHIKKQRSAYDPPEPPLPLRRHGTTYAYLVRQCRCAECLEAGKKLYRAKLERLMVKARQGIAVLFAGVMSAYAANAQHVAATPVTLILTIDFQTKTDWWGKDGVHHLVVTPHVQQVPLTYPDLKHCQADGKFYMASAQNRQGLVKSFHCG